MTIDTAEMDSGAIVVSGTAEDPDGTPPAVTVRLDGPFTSHEQPATGGASWSARFEGLTDDTSYRPVATAVDADGLVVVATGPLVELGNSPANQPPAIEIATSVVAGDCVRVEGQATDQTGASTSSPSRSATGRSSRRGSSARTSPPSSAACRTEATPS